VATNSFLILNRRITGLFSQIIIQTSSRPVQSFLNPPELDFLISKKQNILQRFGYQNFSLFIMIATRQFYEIGRAVIMGRIGFKIRN